MYIRTVLDTDNLHFSEEFSNFWRRRTWISARTCSDFLHDAARKNLDRNSARIHAENGESHSLMKLSQFCYTSKIYVCIEEVANASRLLSKQYSDLQWLYVHSQHS